MTTFKEMQKKMTLLVERIASETGVNEKAVLNVYHYARCLVLSSTPDFIDEHVFTAQMCFRFGITSRFHVSLMFESLREKRTVYIPLEVYVKFIVMFLSHDLDLQIDAVFDIYNFNKSGYISIKEVNLMMKNCIMSYGDEDGEDQLKELIDMLVTMLDKNDDGLISREEFRAFVKHDILCMEMFGKVLPCRSHLNGFQSKVNTFHALQIKDYFKYERRNCLSEPILKEKKDLNFPGVHLDLP